MSDPPCPMIGDELPSAYPHIKELAPGIGSIVDPVAGVGSIVNMLLGGDDSTSSTGGRNLQDSNQDVLQTLEIACGTRFTRSYAKITQKPKCECQNRPWAGSYWAVAQDSIKHHWAGPGTDSIVTKYSKAFGLDEKHLADAVSVNNGIDGRNFETMCSTVTP
uniref:AlNc14C5G730 protein n=1 Tax=Albugo laibachii Nc14 TaxID=890382 RepID=F0W0U5_9STRA|nr:AlNc14C5G730 [Albugo laibachii Nc14]|eukprot:CCA14669.1 AlNc14C5G730 [Albugo laibachii Nc14]